MGDSLADLFGPLLQGAGFGWMLGLMLCLPIAWAADRHHRQHEREKGQGQRAKGRTMTLPIACCRPDCDGAVRMVEVRDNGDRVGFCEAHLPPPKLAAPRRR